MSINSELTPCANEADGCFNDPILLKSLNDLKLQSKANTDPSLDSVLPNISLDKEIKLSL